MSPIIFDNAGGVQVQTPRFVGNYGTPRATPQEAARDVAAILRGESTEGWECAPDKDRICVPDEELVMEILFRTDYTVYEGASEIRAAAAEFDPEDSRCGFAESEFFSALRPLIFKDSP